MVINPGLPLLSDRKKGYLDRAFEFAGFICKFLNPLFYRNRLCLSRDNHHHPAPGQEFPDTSAIQDCGGLCAHLLFSTDRIKLASTNDGMLRPSRFWTNSFASLTYRSRCGNYQFDSSLMRTDRVSSQWTKYFSPSIRLTLLCVNGIIAE